MSIFLFQSVAEPSVFGFTADIAGRNLPIELAPWQMYGNARDVIGGDAAPTAAFGSAVVAAVRRAGFYLAHS